MKKSPEPAGGDGSRGVALVTSGALLPHASLPAAAARLASAGLNLLQVRAGELTGKDLLRLTSAVLGAVSETPCRVVVNGRLDVALAAGAHGVHLPARGLPPARVRDLSPAGFLVGVSAHTTDEAAAAGEAGADYMFYGPVFPTASHPGAPGIGRQGLQAALEVARIPLWAIGGIDPATVAGLAGLPLAGVACMRALLTGADPAGRIQALSAGPTSPG